MKNKIFTLMVSAMIVGATSVFAMESEVTEKSAVTKRPVINLNSQEDQDLFREPTSKYEMTRQKLISILDPNESFHERACHQVENEFSIGNRNFKIRCLWMVSAKANNYTAEDFKNINKIKLLETGLHESIIFLPHAHNKQFFERGTSTSFHANSDVYGIPDLGLKAENSLLRFSFSIIEVFDEKNK